MEYRVFGKLGWRVSAVGFGAWAIGGDGWGAQRDEDSVCALHAALDRGVNFIDTAQGYGDGHSESLIGRVLSERKENVYVATKVPPVPTWTQWPMPADADPRILFPSERIIGECEKSLRRLRRETIDLYQFHTWAAAFNVYDEWFEAVSRLLRDGKIRAFGVSVPDTTPENVIGALAAGRVNSVQAIYNLFEQFPEWNLLPVCERLEVAVVVRVPFDEGALTGKYTIDTTFPHGDVRSRYFRGGNLAAVVERVEALRAFKDLRHPEMSMAEYALRFSLSHPAVTTVIPGMRNVEQVQANTAAGDGIPLDADELVELRRFEWRKDFWFEEVGLRIED